MPERTDPQTTDAPDPSTEAGVPAPSTEAEKNPHAVALGRLGGLKGGPARARALSSERRQEIARNAALARWRGD